MDPSLSTMAQSLGPRKETASTTTAANSVLRQSKKKGCKQSKCSKWRGGRCRCGRA
jgi:hypothetical protein